MKKMLTILLALTLLLAFGCAQAEEEGTPMRIGALKGPTAMGMAQLFGRDDLSFTIAGAADELTALLVKGELDMAAVPANLASVLYNNTSGQIRAAAINTLGVLYVVEAGDTVQSIADLAGREIYSTGKGTTPEYALDFVLAGNGIDPERDVTVTFKTEATELAAALQAGEATLAVLPEPYVTSVLAGDRGLRRALSLNDEWNALSAESGMVTGVLVVRSAFAQEHPEALAQFLNDYEASAAWVNAEPALAAAAIEEAGVAKAAIAEKAIPYCAITFVSGEEMRTMLEGYLQVLFEKNPKSVGGLMPADDFYFIAE